MGNLWLVKLRRSPLLERIPFRGPASVAVREFRPAAFTYPWHMHPELELTWIIKGSGLRYVGDSVEPFHAGDFCLLGRNLPHTWLSPDGARGPVCSLVVQFDPARWGASLLELPEFARLADLFERALRGLSFDPALGGRLRRTIQERPTPLGQFTALLAVLEDLAEASSRPLCLAPWPAHRRANEDPRVRDVLAFLARNSAGPIPQKEAARLVGLSPAAFSRFFRRSVGKTFAAYLTDLRLSEACRRLLESEHPVSRIAFDSGFENLSTFNRSFRQARGLSPREFRARALEPSASVKPCWD